MNETLDYLEARFFGKPMPTPAPLRPDVIAQRRAEASRQLVLATESDDPRVVETARAQFALMQAAPTPQGISVLKIRRNDPCPCSSGTKFKRCCGRGD